MLTGKQRSYLRAIGNNLDSIMQVGKNGIEDGFVAQVEEALEAREIIKITVLKNSVYGAREACEELCSITGAEPVQVIGNRFIIYRKSKENPSIELPEYKKKDL